MNLKAAAEAVNTAADILREDNDRAALQCVLSDCPVYAGECERDGECYVWRCENPHAPKPIRKLCQYHKGIACYCNGKALCLDAA